MVFESKNQKIQSPISIFEANMEKNSIVLSTVRLEYYQTSFGIKTFYAAVLPRQAASWNSLVDKGDTVLKPLCIISHE